MFITSFRTFLLTLVLISPWSVYAAGLGKLTINSALGQPLDAEIELVAVKNEEISSLAAKLGSVDAFRQAGVDYKSFYSKFNVAIEQNSNGESFIKITSPNVVNEPFLNMLVELSWSSGRLMREYTVLLDPADAARPEPVLPVVNDYDVAVEVQPSERKTIYPVEEILDSESTELARNQDSQHDAKTYGPVKQGDTLSGIVKQYLPDGVDLNQAFIAFFRANRDAFIEDNINLLRTGVVLNIPDQSEIASIPRSEANQEVKMHVANWHSYKDRLAVAASEASDTAHETLTQTDSGQITASMPDEGLSERSQAQDVLQLSKGERMDNISAPNESEDKMLQNKLRMMEEEVIARNLELEEANERIAILEKNISDMQYLLAIENPTLAEAQKQSENLSASDMEQHELELLAAQELELQTKQDAEILLDQEPDIISDAEMELESESIPVISDPTDLLIDTVDNPAENAEQATIPIGAGEPFTSAPAVIDPEEAPSLMNYMMANIQYVGAAAALILIGMLAMIKIRRKRIEDELEAEEAEYASSALRERLATVTAVDTQTPSSATEEMNPDDLEQEDVSDTALFNEPSDAETTDQVEDNMDDQDAQIDLSSDDDMQLQKEQEHSFSDSAEDESSVDRADWGDSTDANQLSDDTEQLDDADFELDLEDETAEQSEQEGTSFNQEIKSGAYEESQNLTASEESKPEMETFPFNDSNELGLGMDADAPESDDSLAVAKITESLNLDDENVPLDQTTEPNMSVESDGSEEKHEFDLEIDAKNSADSGILSNDSSLSDLKSEMDISLPDLDETIEQSAEGVVTGDKDAYWHEVETKIDLAKAYIDMEDNEGAREILEEIANEGDDEQKENAQKMLAQL